MFDHLPLMASTTVSIIDYDQFAKLEDRLQKRRGEPGNDGYKVWGRYDAALRDVMRHHGKSVGPDADVDFYHGGDWFHELYDGFALMTATALSFPLLCDLQTVVAQHHMDAVLSFEGELSTPLFGLNVLVTPTEIFAAWYENNAGTCMRTIQRVGIRGFEFDGDAA